MVGWLAGWLSAGVVGVAVAAGLVVLAAFPAPTGLPLGLFAGVGVLLAEVAGGAGLLVAGWAAVVAAVVAVAAAAVAAAALVAFVGLPLGFCVPVCDLWISIAGPAAMLGAAALWLAVWLGLGVLSLAGVVAADVSGSVVVGLGFFLGLPRPFEVWLGRAGVVVVLLGGPWAGWLDPGWLLVRVTLATAVAGCHSPLEFIRLLGSACFRITPSVISLDKGSLCLE
jgi:hypothetical protein